MQRSSTINGPALRRPALLAGSGFGGASTLNVRRWTRSRSKAEDTILARIDAAEALLRTETWTRILETA